MNRRYFGRRNAHLDESAGPTLSLGIGHPVTGGRVEFAQGNQHQFIGVVIRGRCKKLSAGRPATQIEPKLLKPVSGQPGKIDTGLAQTMYAGHLGCIEINGRCGGPTVH